MLVLFTDYNGLPAYVNSARVDAVSSNRNANGCVAIFVGGAADPVWVKGEIKEVVAKLEGHS